MKTRRKMHNLKLLIFWLDTLFGIFLCAWFALTAALLARAWPHPLALLSLFATAVGLVARAWEFVGAMLGLAASVFVFWLSRFVPMSHFDISSADARLGLFWVMASASLAAWVFERARAKNWDIRKGDKSC